MAEKDTMRFGVHYMMDGYGADSDILGNKDILSKILETLPEELGMHKISEPTVVEVGPMNPKDPGGISGFVMIAESHISFHTFPRRNFVSIDVYTCQDELDTAALKEKFTGVFKIKDCEEHTVDRATRYPVNNTN